MASIRVNILIKMEPLILSSTDATGPQGKWSKTRRTDKLENSEAF